MKKLFAYDITTNSIIASKATLKKAGNPATPEYKALMKMIAEQPTFKVVEKAINAKSGKTTYKGLTIEMMKSYIDAQENPVALCEEFESIRQFAKNNKQRESTRCHCSPSEPSLSFRFARTVISTFSNEPETVLYA